MIREAVGASGVPPEKVAVTLWEAFLGFWLGLIGALSEFGKLGMTAIANLQYGWTLFVNPIDQKYHWGTAAIQIARAGCSVAVYEANDDIGGGARSAELTLPGFTHDVCSAIQPLAVMSITWLS